MSRHVMNRQKRLVLLLSLALFAVLATLAVAATVVTQGALDKTDPHTLFFHDFRCQRPLSAMNAFSDVAKTPKELNCDFGYFDVLDATVGLRCEEGQDSMDDASCNATLRVRFSRHADAAQRFALHTGTSEDLFLKANNASASSAAEKESSAPQDVWVYRKPDPWRFSVKLRSKTHASTVHYKGEDGYSMCSDALEGASWAWENTTHTGETEKETFPMVRQVIERCPLPLAGEHEGEVMLQPLATQGDDGEVFTAVITKPLHRLYEGKWEMHMDMWRQRAVFATEEGEEKKTDANEEEVEQLGRIVVPFELNLQQLRDAGIMVKRAPAPVSGEAATEELMVVATPSGEEEHGKEGDL